MDWRQYDPAIARWTVMDPVTHYEFSPYSAFDNNPAFWSDPSGANSVKYNWNSGNYDVVDEDGKWVSSFEPGMFANYLESIAESIDTFFSLENANESSSGGSNGDGNGGGGKKKGTKSKLSADLMNAYSSSGFRHFVTWFGNVDSNISNSWNSPAARFLVPDKISFGIAGEWAFFGGLDVNTFNFTILTRGEAGIYYTPTINARLGYGSYVSGGLNISAGYFTGDPRNITASMLTGSTYGATATGAYIGKVSVGGSFSPTTIDFSQGFIDGAVGIGVGVGGFIGGQYQWTPVFGTIWQW